MDGQVSHGLVLACFKSCVLQLVFLDSSLLSPGQEKHFGISFITLSVVVREMQLSGFLARLESEKKKERKKERKKMTISNFFQN